MFFLVPGFETFVSEDSESGNPGSNDSGPVGISPDVGLCIVAPSTPDVGMCIVSPLIMVTRGRPIFCICLLIDSASSWRAIRAALALSLASTSISIKMLPDNKRLLMGVDSTLTILTSDAFTPETIAITFVKII